MATTAQRNTVSLRTPLLYENESVEETKLSDNIEEITLSDKWVIELSDHRGRALYNKEYIAPALDKFFNVDALRDGMILSLNSRNYSVMPFAMKNLFTTINGQVNVSQEQLEKNRNNCKRRIEPIFVLSLTTIQLKFWLIERIIIRDKKNV
jgi:hypothetical protein